MDVLLDLMYGDCGKGRIVDYLAKDYDIIARFNGGPNSGHMITYNNKNITLHLIPSGIFHEKTCVIGNGVVIDPVVLRNEIEDLESNGINVRDNLIISQNAHIITPFHVLQDKEKESKLKIGTTGRGIGPCYMSKMERSGVRVCDIDQDYINSFLPLDKYSIEFKYKLDDYIDALNFLLDLKIGYSYNFLNDPNKKILAEGAQGTMLDIDHGTYPYVTSSNSTIGGVLTGLGVSHKNINKVFGVFKSYMTRVGNGPFMTELDNEIGEKIREIGHEYGATTGRKRRCGWLDIPMLKYSCIINGVTDLIMTKSDILNDFEEINACIGYEKNDDKLYEYDHKINELNYNPIYKKFNGWSINNKENLENFIQEIEISTRFPIKMVSFGKNRNDIYLR